MYTMRSVRWGGNLSDDPRRAIRTPVDDLRNVIAVGQGAVPTKPGVNQRLRILVLSWNYPTLAAPQRGLWVERMCDAIAADADVSVIVPTPWVPPLLPVSSLSRFRRVPGSERRGDVNLYFPRVAGSIEYLTHGFDARLAIPRVMALARTLHEQRPFDLVHAHFIYPDGVVASRVGKDLGIPVMTSEHAPWLPWLSNRPRVGAMVEAALPGIKLVTAVSQFLLDKIDPYVDGRVETAVLPNVVDDTVFFPAPRSRDPNELLYVGLIREFKRVDVLLHAVAEVRRSMPALHLRIISAGGFRAYAKDRRRIVDLISSLGLNNAVQFVSGGADPAGVAEAMRRCAFVAVSSRRYETFCSVAAESLACGTPLIITRCGGPEEYVTSDDAVMVEPDSPSAFAEGIREAFRRRDSFNADEISERVVRRFGRTAWRKQAMATYQHIANMGSMRHERVLSPR